MTQKNSLPDGDLAGNGRVAKAGGLYASQHSIPRAECQDPRLIVRDLRATHYHSIHDSFILGGWAAKLKAHGMAVYEVLVMHGNRTGVAWPSYARIAELTGMSRRQVIRKVGELEALRLIHVDERIKVSGEPDTCLITLLDPSEWLPVTRVVTVSHHGSDSQSPPLVTVSHHGSDCESPEPYAVQPDLIKPDLLEPSSSCVTRGSAHVCPICGQTQNDDDGFDLANDGSVFFSPEPEDLNMGPEPSALTDTVQEDPGSAVIAGAAWALLEAAPDFDDAAGFAAKHGALVGLVACDLLTNEAKKADLRNPAGYIRRAVESGIRPNGNAHARWGEVLGAFEAGREPDSEPDPDSYDARLRKYVPAGWEDIIQY